MKMIRTMTGIFLGLIATSIISGDLLAAPEKESRHEVRKVMKAAKAKSRQAARGALVYKTYCVLCHGNAGDGKGPMIKIHGNMKIGKQPRGYLEKIVRGGGVAVGRSEFMPTWEEELSDEQISDVVMYLSLIKDPVSRGEVVFKTNCILCHGIRGDGKGRASVLFDPPPADLTHSDKNDIYKKMIITLGGEAMGRSSVMPVWGEELSEAEIDDVVKYLRTILVVPPPR